MSNSKLKQNVLKVIGKLAEVETGIKIPGWPPPCITYSYQPKRPMKKKEE